MTFKTFATAGCVAALSLTAAAPALAQTPTAPAVTHGAALPGVCILSFEGAIAQSSVGKYVQTRIQQIATQVQSELRGEETAIQTEARTLEGQRGSLDQASLDKRGADLQVRAAAFQRKAQLRERELQATQQKALNRISDEMQPVVRQVYQQRQCGLLLQREAVVLANPAMDVTPAVVTGLNAKITQFTFDRERLDQPAAAPAAQSTTPARR
jgi:outer membrane protein